MKKSLFKVVSLCLLLCAFAACGKKEKTIELPAISIEMDKVTVSLESNRTTGYSWEIVYQSDNIEVLSQDYVAGEATGGAVGVPGVEKISFSVSGTKRGVLVLAYVRPWEDKEPDEYYVLDATFNGDKASFGSVFVDDYKSYIEALK